MKNTIFALSVAVTVALTATSVLAEGYPWRDHSPPFDFLFGNSIDMHQQSKVSGGRLRGFFYIEFTGEEVDGVPVAVHGDETVGWNLVGVPVEAKLISNTSGEHPTWCVAPRDIPRAPGFVFFHWTGETTREDLIPGEIYDGFLMKLTAVETFIFVHDGEVLITPGIDYTSHGNVVTACDR